MTASNQRFVGHSGGLAPGTDIAKLCKLVLRPRNMAKPSHATPLELSIECVTTAVSPRHAAHPLQHIYFKCGNNLYLKKKIFHVLKDIFLPSVALLILVK